MQIILTPTRFEALAWSGALTIAADATPIEARPNSCISQMQNVEKVLLRHIMNAIEEHYIEHLVDEDTGLIEQNLPTVLEYMLRNYGKFTSEEVK